MGHWTDAAAATGCTVVLTPPAGAVAAVSVLGGAPGSRETDLLRPGMLVQRVHAVLLTGGSAFGLAAATGVVRFLEEQGTGYSTRAARVPIVVAAVLYDLAIGSATVRPGDAEGYTACLAASAGTSGADGWAKPVAEGSVGAGTGATVAKAGGSERAWKGGIATAAERLYDGAVVAAIVVVNAFGDIVDPETGRTVAMPRPDPAGRGMGALDLLKQGATPRSEPLLNTTLAIVATTAALDRGQLLRVAEMGHTGIARAINPSHSPADGDTVFALATGEPGAGVREPDLTAIGALGARAVSRAILRAVRAATPIAGVPAIQM